MNTKTLLLECLLVTSALVRCTAEEVSSVPTSLVLKTETPSPFLIPTSTPEPTYASCSALTSTVSIYVGPNWPIYENPDFGIRLRYPLAFYYQTWDVSTFPGKLLSVSFQDQKYRDKEIPQIPNMALNVWDNTERLSIEAWLAHHSTTEPFGTEVNLEFPVYFLWPEVQPEAVTVNDMEGLRFTSDAMGLKNHNVIFAHREWIVEFSYGAFGPDDLGPIYNAMLGSLELESK